MLEAKEVNFAYLRETTLSRLFMALIHPRSGQVLVDGTDIAAMEPADLADKIGYVFQNPDLQILEDTVFDEVAYGPRAKKLSEDKVKRQVACRNGPCGFGGRLPAPFKLWAEAPFGCGGSTSLKPAHAYSGRDNQRAGRCGKRAYDELFKGA